MRNLPTSLGLIAVKREEFSEFMSDKKKLLLFLIFLKITIISRNYY